VAVANLDNMLKYSRSFVLFVKVASSFVKLSSKNVFFDLIKDLQLSNDCVLF